MTRFSASLAMIALAMSAEGFAPSFNHQRQQMIVTSSLSATSHAPYFLDVAETEEQVSASKPTANKRVPAKKNDAHKEGIFAPAVKLGKMILGEGELNRIRGNAIALHSDAIKNFVSTAETSFGNTVLRALFKAADRNGNGTIEMEELEAALKTLGFQFLEEKQIMGIFKRAGGEEKGFLTMDEFMAEAPKTLKTNLVKLAKKNGGDLGFLV
eukprot:scaffold6030_cov199-Amphora_coffeaeformis.AAC.10